MTGAWNISSRTLGALKASCNWCLVRLDQDSMVPSAGPLVPGYNATRALGALERIVGGTVTTIQAYPFAASLQRGTTVFSHTCGGSIINNRSILSAAHCWVNNNVPSRYRVRVGSTNRSSGGWVHNVAQLIGHPQYNTRNHDNDVGVVRVTTALPIGSASVRPANLAGANLHIPDNSNVVAIGWGRTSTNGPGSEQLRHVTLRTVNQARCNADFYGIITANMLCAGWPGGGVGTCFGDSGTGVLFNGVVAGITSFGGWDGCASARYPGVYARVSRYTSWIRNNS